MTVRWFGEVKLWLHSGMLCEVFMKLLCGFRWFGSGSDESGDCRPVGASFVFLCFWRELGLQML